MRFEGKSGNRVGNNQGNGGSCVCVKCNIEVPHRSGVPCYELTCPECGSIMERDSNITSNTTSTQNATRAPKIDLELCIGCARCVSSCPFDAITMVNKKAVIDESICRGCMKCISACPVGAIARN